MGAFSSLPRIAIIRLGKLPHVQGLQYKNQTVPYASNHAWRHVSTVAGCSWSLEMEGVCMTCTADRMLHVASSHVQVAFLAMY